MLRTALAHPHIYLPKKRDLLLFDQIGIIALEANLPDMAAQVVADLEFLESRHVIYDAKLIYDTTDAAVIGVTRDEMSTSIARSILAPLLRWAGANPNDDLPPRDFIIDAALELEISEAANVELAADLALDMASLILEQKHSHDHLFAMARPIDLEELMAVTRMYSRNLQVDTGAAATVLLPELDDGIVPVTRTPGTIIHVVLAELPMPDDSVPLEQLLDFRSDPVVRSLFRRMRRWMTVVATENRSRGELTDEIDYLVSEYEQFMRQQRIKINRGVLETVLTTSLEVVENLMNFKPSKAMKALFSVRDRQIALFEAERDAPGRDLAYISITKEQFGSGA